jgi:hypothetical protein
MKGQAVSLPLLWLPADCPLARTSTRRANEWDMPALALSADTEFMDASERLSAARGFTPDQRTPQTCFAQPLASTRVPLLLQPGQAPFVRLGVLQPGALLCDGSMGVCDGVSGTDLIPAPAV